MTGITAVLIIFVTGFVTMIFGMVSIIRFFNKIFIVFGFAGDRFVLKVVFGWPVLIGADGVGFLIKPGWLCFIYSLRLAVVRPLHTWTLGESAGRNQRFI